MNKQARNALKTANEQNHPKSKETKQAKRVKQASKRAGGQAGRQASKQPSHPNIKTSKKATCQCGRPHWPDMRNNEQNTLNKQNKHQFTKKTNSSWKHKNIKNTAMEKHNIYNISYYMIYGCLKCAVLCWYYCFLKAVCLSFAE